MSDLYIAKHPFAALHDGTRTIVRPGDVVEEGHWLLAARPDAFKALEVTHPAPKKAAKAPAKTEDIDKPAA